jgi:hypothetical protein
MRFHRTPAPWILAGVLGLAAPLRAGVDVGDPAPELKGDVWINAGKFRGKSLADLRRSAVLLEYWQTW